MPLMPIADAAEDVTGRTVNRGSRTHDLPPFFGSDLDLEPSFVCEVHFARVRPSQIRPVNRRITMISSRSPAPPLG